jgi:hypothetical protein
VNYTVANIDMAISDLYPLPERAWSPTSYAWEHLLRGPEGAQHELPGIGTLRVVEIRDEEFEAKCWVVVSVTDADGNVRCFRRNGWRASHDGSYLGGPTEEVLPRAKVVTDWIPLQEAQ